MDKKRILTGDRPTGKLHIGHYFGSLKKRLEMQESGKYDPYILIADVQALTDNFNNPEKVRKNVREVAMDYLSVGIDPKKTTIYIQSMIPEVAELTVFYSNLVTIARLQRNPTVKTEIAQKRDLFGESVTYGFLGYPVSQAADITAFEGELVPVGEDQKQHLELTRDIVIRLNHQFGTPEKPVLKLPEPLIRADGARVMSLTDGTRKMSKSDPSEQSRINLLDSPETITKKIKRCKTDAVRGLTFDDPERPEARNLLTLYLLLSGKSKEEVAAECQDMGWGEFKPLLTETTINALKPIQDKYKEIMDEPGYLDSVLRRGKEQAETIANQTLTKVKTAFGYSLPN